MRRAALLLLPLLFLASSLRADTVTTRDGKRLTGKIVSDDGTTLTLEGPSGKQTIERRNVLAIVHEERSSDLGGPRAPAGDEGKAAAPASTDGLPEATRLEKEGLALEGRGEFALGMAKFEESLRSTLTADAKDPGERGARVEFLVHRLAFFWNKLGEHARGVSVLRDVVANEGVPAYSRDVARWYLVGQLRSAGQSKEADAEMEKLGWSTAWYVIGPFDNERGTAFATAYGPETDAFDPAAHYKGKKREVAWRPVPSIKPLWGEVDLDAMMRPNDQCLAYALTYLKVDTARKVVLRIASDEALKVWVDRKEVDAEDKRRPLKFDQTHVGVELAAGWHEVLLKVCDQTGPWGFRCRVTAPEGGPASGVRWAALDEIRSKQELASGAPDTFKADKGAFTWLESRRKADPTDDRTRFRLGYLYYADRPHDDDAHTDREILDEARALRPDDATYQVFYSHTAAANAEFSVNKEENKRRQALERAIQIDPQHAQALWHLASYYETSLASYFRAEELAKRAIEVNPRFLDAELMLLSIQERRGLHPLVARRLLELAATPDAHHYAPLMRRLLQVDAQRGDTKAQTARLEELLALDQADGTPLHQRAELEKSSGRLDAAAKLLEQALALSPWNVALRKELATIHEDAGDLAAAEHDLNGALEIAPEDDSVVVRLGHLVEREGRDEEAHHDLERALELNPNLVDLKKYLEWVDRKKEGVADWEDDWKIDAASVIEEAKKTPTDSNLTARILLRNVVTKVNPDGTSSRFQQEIARVENDEGRKDLGTDSIYFQGGEQKAAFKVARVYRKGGEVEDAPVSETTGSGGGEFARYEAHSVEVSSTLEVGDVVEIQSRIDDLKQGFFGDYFGTDERFAEFEKPIDRMRFVVIAPKEKQLYVHKTGLDDVKDEVRTDEAKKVTIRSWEKKAIAKIEREPHMTWDQEVLPKVQVSTFGDWNTFAKWYWGLVKKQQEADDSIKAKVAELTKDCKTDEDKIRKIYEFVVTDIRYNSAWEFGVHGFKPYNATSIYARKFGDCKDKATLINTMLGEVGIKSYPVLIFGANPRGKEDLALPLMHHFNHCISYVPGAKDGQGMWLDGTAQYHPFDTLPTMDYGATTLIIEPDKGELKTIPFRGPEANLEREHHEVTIKADGGADVRSVFEGTGDFNWYHRETLATKGRRQEVIEQRIGRHFSGAKVKSVTCSDLENLDVPVKVEVEYGVPKIFQKSTGGYAVDEIRSWLFDAIYTGGQKLSAFAAKDTRDFDVVLEVPSGVEEEIVYELPSGMDVKNLPKETKLKSDFGEYTRTYKVDKGKIHVVRKLAMKTNRIPRESYEDFRKFVGEIERAENERVVLSKEGGEE
jgi:tetratricopeptide (TPR) repeat protein